jgi:thiamine-monophosphate kinase
VDEFQLIERFFVRRDEGEGAGVVVSIGDDGAVLTPDPGRDLVTVVDTLVSDVHFPVDLDAADIGYRSVAVNLSDIAAMGARPRWMTLALTIPEADPSWLEAFAAGLFEAASEFGIQLVGGDTTRGRDVVVSVQLTGDIEPGRALLRSGANPGDTIFVTGTLGDAAAGLACLRKGDADETLWLRYRRPTARVDYGRRLVGAATAAIDISDGLIGDLHKLLDASGVGAEIAVNRLPLSSSLTARFDAQSALRFALTGGDDYELCFSASEESLPDSAGLPVTPLGIVTAERGLVLRDEHGVVSFADSGYRHFA